MHPQHLSINMVKQSREDFEKQRSVGLQSALQHAQCVSIFPGAYASAESP
jgi:hypothetical protein